MAASPLDVSWYCFRKFASEEGTGTIKTPPTKRTLINAMPDKSSGEKVARACGSEPSEPKEMNTSNALPAVSEVDAAMVRRWEDEFDVLFKAARKRDSCKAKQPVPSESPVQNRDDDFAHVVEKKRRVRHTRPSRATVGSRVVDTRAPRTMCERWHEARRPCTISDCLCQDTAEALLKGEGHIRERFIGGLKHRSVPWSRSDHSSRGWQRRSDCCDSSTKLRTVVRDDGWEVDAIQQLDREE